MRRFLQGSLFLFGSFLGGYAGGQAVLPAGALTPETFSRFCATQGQSCTLPLHEQNTLTLPGEWRLPRSMHLRFAVGSALHVTGGVLHFDGGTVEAPATDRIFPDADHVAGLAAARPEWFAGSAETPEQHPLSAAALAAAYAATEPWGTIYLQSRRYLSPFSGCTNAPASLRYLSTRTLVGSARPVPDDPSQPTRLQGGTILVGGIMGTAPVRLAHLGIDAGPEVSAQLAQDCRPPGVFIEQPHHEFVSGDRLEDVSVLTTGASNMHSVMIAGHENTLVRDLWIWTLGGTHGLVMKSSNSVVDGLHCFGAISDCLIVKSDYETDLLGRAVHDRIAHVEIAPLRPGMPVGGIMVDSRWDTVRAIHMQDITETGTQFGVVVLGSNFFRPSDISVENWTADAVGGMCLFADHSDAVQVSKFRCSLRPSAEAGVMLQRSKDIALRSGSLRCDGTAAECAAGHTDGLFDDSAGTSLHQVVAEGLGGYLVHGVRPLAKLGDAQGRGMGNRTFLRYSSTLGMRLHVDLVEVKPSLRILYTGLTSRVALRPRLYGILAALMAAVAVWEMAGRRSRHPQRR